MRPASRGGQAFRESTLRSAVSMLENASSKRSTRGARRSALRERRALALSAGKGDAAFSDEGVESAGE